MSLLTSLPAELRLRIYEYLPDLQPHRYESLTSHSTIPPICQANRTLRTETLPIFAANTSFVFTIDDAGRSWNRRIACLLDGLGASSVSKIRNLQISRHWIIPLPQRWQGHVGFYVRLEQRKSQKAPSTWLDASHTPSSRGSFRSEWNDRFVQPTVEGLWEVTTGTYPVARDMRGMRLESIELLASIFRQHLQDPSPVSDSCADETRNGLKRQDIDFLLDAMDIVASHPISTYDLEQDESARGRRQDTYSNMEKQLRALHVHAPPAPSSTRTASSFFTPN